MSKVSRSTYQKLAEENKRLIKDLRLICAYDSDMAASFECQMKWVNHFKEEDDFNQAMRQAAKEWMDNNPNDPATKFVLGLNNSENASGDQGS